MRNQRNLFIIFIVVMLILAGIYFVIEQKADRQMIKKVKDQLSTMLRSELDAKKQNALRYALMISRNDGITNAMKNDDEERGYIILSELMHAIKQYTNILIRAQIITDDYLIFSRSWDNAFAGMPIDEYRPDLRYFQENRKPRSAIEVGRRLGIKATVPIHKDGEHLGFVEVLQFFEGITEYFRNMGVELYILMDDRFYGISILMQDNPFVADKYIVSNRYYNKIYLEDLNQIDFETLKLNGDLVYNRKIFFYENMLNGTGEVIGGFVMVVPENDLRKFNVKTGELATLTGFTRTELYEINKIKNQQATGYKSHYDKQLLYLKDVVPEEDRELFREEAREVLSEYSKEELIGLIMNYNISRKIEGEIR